MDLELVLTQGVLAQKQGTQIYFLIHSGKNYRLTDYG